MSPMTLNYTDLRKCNNFHHKLNLEWQRTVRCGLRSRKPHFALHLFFLISNIASVAKFAMTSRLIFAPMQPSMWNLHSDLSLYAAVRFNRELVILSPWFLTFDLLFSYRVSASGYSRHEETPCTGEGGTNPEFPHRFAVMHQVPLRKRSIFYVATRNGSFTFAFLRIQSSLAVCSKRLV